MTGMFGTFMLVASGVLLYCWGGVFLRPSLPPRWGEGCKMTEEWIRSMSGGWPVQHCEMSFFYCAHLSYCTFR